jgi:hypothetical protein
LGTIFTLKRLDKSWINTDSQTPENNQIVLGMDASGYFKVVGYKDHRWWEKDFSTLIIWSVIAWKKIDD